MDRLNPVDYLLIGHITADLVPDGRALGGTVSYCAGVAAAFGLRIGVLTSARSDDPLLDTLRQSAAVKVVPADATTTFENIYTAKGRTQYVRATAATMSIADVPDEWLGASLVHVGPITPDEIDLAVLDRFPDARIMLTPQGWLRRWGSDGLVRFKRWFDEAAIRRADLIVISEEDIVEAPDMEQEMAAIARCLVVTRSYSGGTYFLNGKRHAYTAYPAEVLNATGAGDVFAASLLAALPLMQYNMHSAIQVAAILAANSVTRFGLDSAPTRDEIAAAVARAEANQ
jgi:sugar/nucleoside kinase (ribokinase family)